MAEFSTSTDILVAFSGRIDDQNVVVGRINGVFLLENVLVFRRDQKYWP